MASPRQSFTETVQVVLPNDANPLGFVLGGYVMHQIDLVGAIAAYRHTRGLLVTAAVDGLQFLHPIRVGDLMIVNARVTAAFRTSLEVEVEVFSEETLTGKRQQTSVAYLTFVTLERNGQRATVPPLDLESDDDRRRSREAEERRKRRLANRK
jgi:acyl-CoA hydrolase